MNLGWQPVALQRISLGGYGTREQENGQVDIQNKNAHQQIADARLTFDAN